MYSVVNLMFNLHSILTDQGLSMLWCWIKSEEPNTSGAWGGRGGLLRLWRGMGARQKESTKEAAQNVWRWTPPPRVLTRARLWLRGGKCANTVSPCLDRPILPPHAPRNTCCRHKPTLPRHDCKRVSNRAAYTPEHDSTWNCSCTNTFTPALTLPAAHTKLQTIFSIGWEPQKRWFQNTPKCAESRGRRVWTSPS